MYETTSKIVFLLFTTCIVPLISIYDEHKQTGNVRVSVSEALISLNTSQMSPEEEFEYNLKKFKSNRDINRTSQHEIWNLITPLEIGIPLTKKYVAVQNLTIPPGMNGEPVFLRPNIKNPLRAMVQQGYRDHAFNEFVSGLIPLDRSLPDVRTDWCKQRKYSSQLPKVSVVITFHNEAWSTLLRTIHSVLNRTPNHLLKEIILIDDISTLHHLQKRLSAYIKTLPKVILKRTPTREGLIRARILAIKFVTAPVVVFLDSHVECVEGWIEPLLDRISKDPTRVVSPIIDVIHDKTFEYIPQEVGNLRIGGFDWDLNFIWEAIPSKILAKRKQLAAPIKTPTISGGIFAIDKIFFKKLGYFDEHYLYWGAENMELSFKTWMCGGSLEMIPCSHVGHVFRKKFPYFKQPNSLIQNYVRLAEVWLDDYSKYFYERNNYEKYKDQCGNLTERKLLRQQLKCKSFDWYLKTVYPQQTIPSNYVARGMIYGLSGDELCFESNISMETLMDNLKLTPCDFRGGNQFWVYTTDGELKRRNLCLGDMGNNETVMMNLCHGQKSQVWVYNNITKMIQNVGTHLCITGDKMYPSKYFQLNMQPCDATKHRQKWVLQNYDESKLSPELIKFGSQMVEIKNLDQSYSLVNIDIVPSRLQAA